MPSVVFYWLETEFLLEEWHSFTQARTAITGDGIRIEQQMHDSTPRLKSITPDPRPNVHRACVTTRSKHAKLGLQAIYLAIEAMPQLNRQVDKPLNKSPECNSSLCPPQMVAEAPSSIQRRNTQRLKPKVKGRRNRIARSRGNRESRDQ